MQDRQRFVNVMSYQSVDRVPAYYFGYWWETLQRWKQEGLREDVPLTEQAGLDSDWEEEMWGLRGLACCREVHRAPYQILEQTETYKIVQHPSGAVTKESMLGSSIPEHVKEALEPTWESWKRFKVALDPELPEHKVDPVKLQAMAEKLNNQEGTVCLLGGSLYGWPREWMGTEAIAMLAYDDPALYEEIIDTVAEMYMKVVGSIMDQVQVDFIYLFEDCCRQSRHRNVLQGAHSSEPPDVDALHADVLIGGHR